MITEEKGDNDHPLHNLNYHSPADTVETLNLDFHAEVTRGILATIAALASGEPLF